jgi:hypothetical protein
MSIILRVDVDKPYGNSNFLRKICSKLEEDYVSFRILNSKKYLTHLIGFLEFCNTNKVPSILYFRHCTIPNKKVLDLIKIGGHKIGLHAENTRSFETFKNELSLFRKKLNSEKVDSFSKHGSGNLKLGKYHYPPFEPQKYLEWSKSLDIRYISGNDIAEKKEELFAANNYFSRIFWIEREYRSKDFFDLKKVVDAAKENDIVVLIHPCNFDSTKAVLDDFIELIRLAKMENVSWKVI